MSISNSTQTLESMSQAVWYNQWTLKKFEDYLKGEILEVGCGIGNFTRDLKKYGHVWAIDINESYIKQVSVLAKDRIGVGDIEKGKYFFGVKKFDCIVCFNVLEHIENDQIALRNMYELLKARGYLILLVPAHALLYGEIDRSIGHIRRYNKKDLIKMLTATGFNIIKDREINFLGAIGWWISSKLLSSAKVDEGKIKIFNFIAPFALSVEDIFETPFGTSILVIAQK